MTSREEFEKKVSTEFEQPPCLDRNGDGYDDGYVDNAWWGWQACASHYEARIKALQGDGGEPVIEIVKDTSDWYMAGKYADWLKPISELPVGTKLYTATPNTSELEEKLNKFKLMLCDADDENDVLQAKLDNAIEALQNIRGSFTDLHFEEDKDSLMIRITNAMQEVNEALKELEK